MADLLSAIARALPELSFKAALVTVIAGLLAYTLRRRSAAARHLVWSVAVAGVLALPLAQLLPARIAVLPASLARPEAAPAPVSPAAPTIDAADAGETDAFASAEAATASPETTTLPAVVAPEAEASWWASLGTAEVLVGIWLLGAVALLLRLAVGTGTVWWLARTGERIDDEAWTLAADRISRGFDAPSARLIRSRWTEMPMTWGMLRPVVLLPQDCDAWPAERRDVVLRHELAHVARRDVVTLALAQVACAVHWFNPLVWLAAHQLRAEAERCCDDWVLRSGTRASTYAGHLLEMVRIIGRARVPSALALPMAQRSTFEGRLLAILEPGVERGTAGRAALTAGALAVLVAVLGAMRPMDAAVFPAPVSSAVTETADREDAADPATSPETETLPSAGAALQAETLAARMGPGTASVTAAAPAGVGEKKPVTSTALAALLGAVRDRDVAVRRSAVRSLGTMADPRGVEALVRALRTDADAEVRRTAAWALGQIEDRAAVPALLEAMAGDRAIEVRRTATWALGQIEDASAVDGLARAVRSDDAEVRETAVWALGQIESPRGIPALTAALREGDVRVRRGAAWALGQTGAKESAAVLVAALRDADREVRETAVWALGQIEAPEAVGPLGGLLRDPEPRVRQQAAWALGQIEAESAVPALATAVQSDADTGVRQTAAWALGQIESEGAVPALSAALRDADPKVRAQAAWALGQVEPDRAPPALLAAVRDADATVRRTAVWALGQIGEPSALEALLRDGDAETRAAAAAAMASRNAGGPRPQPRPQPRPRPRPRPEI